MAMALKAKPMMAKVMVNPKAMTAKPTALVAAAVAAEVADAVVGAMKSALMAGLRSKLRLDLKIARGQLTAPTAKTGTQQRGSHQIMTRRQYLPNLKEMRPVNWNAR
jgi:hypothetical protein